MVKDSERQVLQSELERELARDDSIGRRERRAAVKGLLLLLDTIDELCRDSLGNYRYLEELSDPQAEGDDGELEEGAPDAAILDVLVNAIYAGDLEGKLIFSSRLEYLIMPALKQFWDKVLKDQDLYTPLGIKDDINRQGLEGWQLEAKCGLCGQSFMPADDSFIGLNNQSMGLYWHQQKMDDERGEINCGGYGIITGGFKGTERITK